MLCCWNWCVVQDSTSHFSDMINVCSSKLFWKGKVHSRISTAPVNSKLSHRIHDSTGKHIDIVCVPFAFGMVNRLSRNGDYKSIDEGFFFLPRIKASVKIHLSWVILLRVFLFSVSFQFYYHYRGQWDERNEYRSPFNFCLRKKCDKNEFHFKWPQIFFWIEQKSQHHIKCISIGSLRNWMFFSLSSSKEIGQFSHSFFYFTFNIFFCFLLSLIKYSSFFFLISPVFVSTWIFTCCCPANMQCVIFARTHTHTTVWH